jgi:hypothetical protein
MTERERLMDGDESGARFEARGCMAAFMFLFVFGGSAIAWGMLIAKLF